MEEGSGGHGTRTAGLSEEEELKLSHLAGPTLGLKTESLTNVAEKNRVHHIGPLRPSLYLQEQGPQPSRQADAWASKGWTHNLLLGTVWVVLGLPGIQPCPGGCSALLGALPTRKLNRALEIALVGSLNAHFQYRHCGQLTKQRPFVS